MSMSTKERTSQMTKKSKTVKVTNQQTGTTQSWTNDSLASSLQLAALYMASHPGHSFTVEVAKA